MTDLVACLSSGKGTWAHLNQVIEQIEWDNIFLVTNEFGKENFKPEKEVNFILIDDKKTITEITEDIKAKLKGKLSGTEVGINIVSGTGKEHTKELEDKREAIAHLHLEIPT